MLHWIQKEHDELASARRVFEIGYAGFDGLNSLVREGSGRAAEAGY